MEQGLNTQFTRPLKFPFYWKCRLLFSSLRLSQLWSSHRLQGSINTICLVLRTDQCKLPLHETTFCLPVWCYTWQYCKLRTRSPIASVYGYKKVIKYWRWQRPAWEWDYFEYAQLATQLFSECKQGKVHKEKGSETLAHEWHQWEGYEESWWLSWWGKQFMWRRENAWHWHNRLFLDGFQYSESYPKSLLFQWHAFFLPPPHEIVHFTGKMCTYSAAWYESVHVPTLTPNLCLI